MARSTNQKKKISVLRNILLERTNESHPMTMTEIINALAAHDIRAERKSLYSDMETLRELGLDIQSVRGKTTAYYVASREFELPELKLLVDAVRASKFIPEKQSAELIKKLSSLAGAHDRKALNRAVFVTNRVKSLNSDIYNSVDTIHEAIENDLDITFKYFSWTYDKRKSFRNNGERYRISPWSLVWDDSNYYLVGFDTARKSIRHYRVDKMVAVQTTEFKRSGQKEFSKFDLGNAYTGAVFGMFGGKTERVTLSCKKSLANVMIDRFGTNLVTLNEGENFVIHANVVPSPIFFGWVSSFEGEVKILAPQEIKENYKSFLEKLSD